MHFSHPAQDAHGNKGVFFILVKRLVSNLNTTIAVAPVVHYSGSGDKMRTVTLLSLSPAGIAEGCGRKYPQIEIR